MPTTDASAMPIHLLDDVVTFISSLDDPHGVIADDLEGEFNFPHQSFTIRGREAFERLHNHADPRPWSITVRGSQPLPNGILLDADITSSVGHTRTVTPTSPAPLKHDPDCQSRRSPAARSPGSRAT